MSENLSKEKRKKDKGVYTGGGKKSGMKYRKGTYEKTVSEQEEEKQEEEEVGEGE